VSLEPTVLVTAGTGTVGRHVVGELARLDVPVRVGSRDPESARERFSADREESPAERDGDDPDSPAFDDFPTVDPEAPVDFVPFDFERPETWGPVLDGIDSLFLVSVPGVDGDELQSFVDAAARVGVGHVAYLSTLGAQRNPAIPHYWNERHIRGAALDHTFLRASFFCQNFHEVHRTDVVDHDELFVPAGTGETSFVDARDVAAVAAHVLAESDTKETLASDDPSGGGATHVNRAYDLTGPTALTYHEAAEIFSEELDRRISYPEPSIPAFVRRRRSYGDPLGYALLMVGIYTTARLGLAGRVTDDVERLLGRPPRHLREYVADYTGAFETPPDG
jgi:uncharacterized protein YbjT (DUF2867 family)